MKDTTILLVEDNADDQMLTLKAFERVGLPDAVRVVKDGVEALDYLFARGRYADRDSCPKPALVLLDLKLPKLSGLEVLRQIRSHEETCFIPVVVLTSSVEHSDVVSCYRSSGNSYIRKPIDFNQFKEAISLIKRYWLELNHPVIPAKVKNLDAH